MTTAHAIDWPRVLADRLTTTSPDVLRELLATFIHTLMGAEPTRCAGPVTTDAAVNGPISATGIGIVSSPRAQAVWIWRSLSCGTARISRTGWWTRLGSI